MRRLIPFLFCLTACISGGQRPSTTSVVPATSTGTSATETETASTTNQQEQLAYAKNPAVNVYLETSGSMNGYVDMVRHSSSRLSSTFYPTSRIAVCLLR